MKKNLTKKLMLSVLTLAFAVVSLGASTFAWFTTSENAKVDQISYNVTSDAGLEVAVSLVGGENMSNYYIGTLPLEQIQERVLAAGFTTFNNVSYYDIDNNYGFVKDAEGHDTTTGLAPFTKEFYDKNGNKLVDTQSDGSKKIDYVKFQLNVRVDQNGYIRLNVPYLTSGANSSWAAGVGYTANNGKKVLPTTQMEYNILSASRMAIVPVQNENAKIIDSDNTELAPGYYEAKESISTVKENSATEPQQGTSIGNTLGLSNHGALEIYNEKYDGTQSDIKLLPSDVQNVFTSVDADTTNTFTFKASAGVSYAFEIYIWVEGFDAECTNAVFAQALKAKFAFQYASEESKFVAYDWTNQ